LRIQKYVATIAVDGGHVHLLPPHSYSYSMELSPRSAMQKSRASRMQRGMLPSGMYAVLRNILIAQIGFELACPEPGCDGVLSDFALATMDAVFTHQRLANGRCTARVAMRFLRPRVDEPWDQLSGEVFELCTGFDPTDFIQMCGVFEHLPDVIITTLRYTASLRFVIFLLYYRWTCPSGWTDIEERLQQHKSRLIALYQTGVQLIYSVPAYHALSTKLDMPRIYSRIKLWATAVWDTGAAEKGHFIGFVDGAPQRTCRPSTKVAARRDFSTADVQKLVYSGHYSAHGLRLQYVTCVDGIMVAAVDVLPTTDSMLLKKSGIIETLRAVNIDGDADVHPMVYGDPAYAKCDVVARKSKGLRTLLQKQIDRSMQTSRASVEDAFGYLLVRCYSLAMHGI
jgi:hypothetical protein